MPIKPKKPKLQMPAIYKNLSGDIYREKIGGGEVKYSGAKYKPTKEGGYTKTNTKQVTNNKGEVTKTVEKKKTYSGANASKNSSIKPRDKKLSSTKTVVKTRK
jgi:hypothetical protein